MKTRCRNCKTLIEYGNTYCIKCEDVIKVKRQSYKTEKTKEADAYTKTKRWQSLRKEIIRRDKGCCALCFKRGIITYRGLQVHHIIKRVEDLTLAYEPTNLITVCRTCHEEVEKLATIEQRRIFDMEERCKEETHYLL